MAMEVLQILQKKMDVYGYILADTQTGDCAVIDPSTEPEKILEAAKIRSYNIKAVVNTHGHADHTCGNFYILKKTGAKLYLHSGDKGLASKISSKLFSKALGGKSSPVPDFFVEDHDIIEAGSLSMEVIHTPGHTPGGICIYCMKNLFTGDTLFVGDVGRTDLPGGSYETLLESIKKKLYTLPGDTIVWPGHNYSEDEKSTIEKEIRTNPYT